MSVISIENLSKSYRIQHGAVRDKYHMLRDSLAAAATWPLRKLRGKANGSVEEFWALKDVNLEIQQGEVVGFIGRNGAGKSTLLKILSRITPPTGGCVRLRGRVGSLLEVGTGFHPELTGRENVYLNGSILGMSRREIQAKFDEIVEFSGVAKFLDTPVKRYSSGMYVRLAFAVAAHLEPEILIIDEVLAVGDAQFQKKCLGKMREVSKDGRTILFVSHNMVAIGALCKKVAWIQSGTILDYGDTSPVVEKYRAYASDGSLESLPIHRKPRTGTGAAHFTNIVVRPLGTNAEDTAEQMITGNSVEIELEVTSYSGIEDANVALTLYDSDGYRIIDANTALKGEFLTLKPGQKGNVLFTLHDLLLKPGKYTLETWLGHGGVEDIDFVREAGSIDVHEDMSLVRHTESFPGVYRCCFSHAIVTQDLA